MRLEVGDDAWSDVSDIRLSVSTIRKQVKGMFHRGLMYRLLKIECSMASWK
jgi:hypothetical protein